MANHAGRNRRKVQVLFLLAACAIFSASSSEDTDLFGRRGGHGGMSATGSFAISAGNRAGNSENTVAFMGDAEQDDSFEDIVIPSDVSEMEAINRVRKAFAKKQSSEGKKRATVLDASAQLSHQSDAISGAGGNP